MRVTVQKWGNSLAVRIPKAVARQANVSRGSEMELSVEDSEIVLRPLRLPRFDLAEMVSKVTDENRHEWIGDGGAVGGEAW